MRLKRAYFYAGIEWMHAVFSQLLFPALDSGFFVHGKLDAHNQNIYNGSLSFPPLKRILLLQ